MKAPFRQETSILALSRKSSLGARIAVFLFCFSIVFGMNQDDRRPFYLTSLFFRDFETIVILHEKGCFVNIVMRETEERTPVCEAPAGMIK